MVEIQGPEGDLCAGIPLTYQAINAENCLTIEWVVIGSPDGVSDDDIVFSAPFNLVTNITVPIEGEYQFSVNCCEAV